MDDFRCCVAGKVHRTRGKKVRGRGRILQGHLRKEIRVRGNLSRHQDVPMQM